MHFYQGTLAGSLGRKRGELELPVVAIQPVPGLHVCVGELSVCFGGQRLTVSVDVPEPANAATLDGLEVRATLVEQLEVGHVV